jgi:hypothetical protein
MSESSQQELKKARLQKLRERLMREVPAEELQQMKAELDVLERLDDEKHDHDLDTDSHHDHEHT